MMIELALLILWFFPPLFMIGWQLKRIADAIEVRLSLGKLAGSGNQVTDAERADATSRSNAPK